MRDVHLRLAVVGRDASSGRQAGGVRTANADLNAGRSLGSFLATMPY